MIRLWYLIKKKVLEIIINMEYVNELDEDVIIKNLRL